MKIITVITIKMITKTIINETKNKYESNNNSMSQ